MKFLTHCAVLTQPRAARLTLNLTSLFILFLLLSTLFLTQPQIATAQTVNIPDAGLRGAIEEALGKTSGETILQTDMTRLVSLDARGRRIRDLTGLEYATRLLWLRLNPASATRENRNQVSDLTPLRNLTSLIRLNLSSNEIVDVTPLQNLTNLTWLNLNNNNIADFTPIQGIVPNLEYYVNGNQDPQVYIPNAGLRKVLAAALQKAADAPISPDEMTTLTTLTGVDAGIQNLKGLQFATNLVTLSLEENAIVDVAPLQNLTQLTQLNLNDNQIVNVAPLQNLTQLTQLNLSDNSIVDITALQNLTQLTTLSLQDNSIVDITALQNLTQLTTLSLQDNSIVDITALQNLTQLTTLFISGNPIVDACPIAGYIDTLEQFDGRALPIRVPDAGLRGALEAALSKQPGGTITIQEMESLQRLVARGLGIQDLSCLQFASNLTFLSVTNNRITDVTPLLKLTKLKTLYVGGNSITDISPIAGYVANLDTFDGWGQPIRIPDPGLRRALESALSKGPNDNITMTDMATLTSLTAQNHDIQGPDLPPVCYQSGNT